MIWINRLNLKLAANIFNPRRKQKNSLQKGEKSWLSGPKIPLSFAAASNYAFIISIFTE